MCRFTKLSKRLYVLRKFLYCDLITTDNLPAVEPNRWVTMVAIIGVNPVVLNGKGRDRSVLPLWSWELMLSWKFNVLSHFSLRIWITSSEDLRNVLPVAVVRTGHSGCGGAGRFRN